MAVIGLTIDKIEAERKGAAPRVEVKLTPSIADVEKSKLEGVAEKPRDVLIVKFSFDVSFNPDVGKLKIDGNLVYMGDADKAYKEWQKNKKLPENINTEVMNFIFRSVTPKAFFIANELQLPPILPVPRIARAEKKQEG